MIHKEIPDYTFEYFYPFGNYQEAGYDTFSLFIRSPSQCYYSELFGSFILTPEDAWKFYIQLLQEQQCPDCFRGEMDILESIPDHMASLELQFKHNYSKAYYNIINYYKNII